MTTLCLAEHAKGVLADATARAVGAAANLGAPVHVLVIGENAGCAAARAASLRGVEKVRVCDAEALAHHLPEPTAMLLAGLAGDYDAFVAPSTATWKSVLPRLAALLDVMYISDVTAVVSADTFERPIYAGNAIQTVRSADAKKVITVRTAVFAPAPADGSASVELLETAVSPSETSKVTGESISRSERPDLASARIVISGGRGMQSAANFTALIEPLADELGAAIGASRAAVDAGYAGNDRQVGQTGKVVAPDLYIAVGISGAIQHLAGMKDSKVIVAINKDGDAPIFQIADYKLVEDLNVALPQLQAALSDH